jgi:hypothetical protein
LVDCCSKVNSSFLVPREPVRMERSDAVQQEYASFLIRMWREVDPAALDAVADWYGVVEHIQSGRRSEFASEADMWDFLHLSLARVYPGKTEAQERSG